VQELSLFSIYSSYIGFGGGIPILLIFIAFYKKYVPVSKLFGISLFIYWTAVFTGYGIHLSGILPNLDYAYYVSGIIAPILYCVLASVWLQRGINKKSNEKTDLDHLIES